ncbi:MAG: hypothetical protein AAB442_02060 [Patescibacteria group bacterium]
MFRKVVHFFDRAEDRIRGALSHHPIFYSFVGGIGIILFWKGVWETAALFPVLHGIGSLVLGMLILLMTGLMVSILIGDSIILSGLKGEKKLIEKTETELEEEGDVDERILEELHTIEETLTHREEHHKG